MTAPSQSDKHSFVAGTDEPKFYGVYCNVEGARRFWRITCPCGTVAEHPVNGLPTVDTPHPCGNEKHWTVKFAAGAAPLPELQRGDGPSDEALIRSILTVVVVGYQDAVRKDIETLLSRRSTVSARSLTSDGCTAPESHGRFFSDGRRRCDTCGAWGDKDSPLRCTFVSATQERKA